MQIVIDIPQGLKDDFESERWTALTCAMMKDALKEGTILPKGHGRLIDADALNFADIDSANYGSNYIRIAPTIIEADKAESEENMTDNEFLLQDRLQKIRQIINKYGEENFYISFSGGKDSTVLSALVDMALPENKIPRVYANTGIELNMIRDFVFDLQKTDVRIVVIKPSVPIKQMLERDGYPFKSKHHSEMLKIYQRNPDAESPIKYKNREYNFNSNKCPKCLQYQFEPTFDLKISDECCDRLKKEPLSKWQKENNKPFGIVGIMPTERGQRESAVCLAFEHGKFKNFQPLVPVTKEWEDWFIEKYNVRICDIYRDPYNFSRTGCKGCPFNIKLQDALDTLEKYFPIERKQCEAIWKPVYDEYRRIGYRLKKK